MMLCERLEGSFRLEDGRCMLSDVEFKIIDGPLARGGTALLQELENDIAQGESHLNNLIEATRNEAQGQANILYRLAGATPAVSTPMQYGGHFLERDRELLSVLAKQSCVALYVQGGEGVYIDFVSDLPAQMFAWNTTDSCVSVNDVRAMRQGKLATDDPGADILIERSLIEALEKMSIG